MYGLLWAARFVSLTHFAQAGDEEPIERILRILLAFAILNVLRQLAKRHSARSVARSR